MEILKKHGTFRDHFKKNAGLTATVILKNTGLLKS